MSIETDGRRVRGAETRARILERASEVATIDGLNGLSLAHLAEDLQLSKSGVHALFGTKEDLQLATIATARRRFIEVVITPLWAGPEGLARVNALVSSWVDYIRRREFPGGCFVTRWSAEFGSRPGRVRDALGQARDDWLGMLEGQLAVAVLHGELEPAANAAQLAFEIDALLVAGNTGALYGDEAALDRAERGVEVLLAEASAGDPVG